MDLAPTTSSTSMLVLGDALAISLLEANKFSKKDFAENHPGGSLGKKFYKVKDLMIKAKDIPILPERTELIPKPLQAIMVLGAEPPGKIEAFSICK